MTLRRNRAIGVTPEQVAEVIPPELTKLPDTSDLVEYRRFIDRLGAAVDVFTRTGGDLGFILAVAEIHGANPASWYRKQLARLRG